MDNATHLNRLRAMLAQVSPESSIELLESSFDSNREGIKDEDIAALAIKKISRNESLDGEAMMSLEAIVLPRYRPVIDIINGTFSTPPEPWIKLGDGQAKQNIDRAIPSIGRIELPNHPRIPYAGTGFVVGRDLLMTNRHVAEIFCSGLGDSRLTFRPGMTSAVDFKREVLPSPPVLLTVDRVVMIHPFWDMALLHVKGLPADHPILSISTTHPDDLSNRDIAVVGYPAQDDRNDIALQNQIFRGLYNIKRLQPGKLKSRRLRESYGREVNALTHDASTLGGNSGSAIVDIQSGEVVGLHFAGIYLDSNFAVPTYELARDSRVVDMGVNFHGSVEGSSVYVPLWQSVDLGEIETSGAVNQPSSTHTTTAGQNFPNSPNRPAEPQPRLIDGTEAVTWTIPIQVTISLGTPNIAQGVVSVAAPSPRIEGIFGPKPSVAQIPAKFSIDTLRRSDFNWKSALSLVLASNLVYEQPQIIEQFILGWGFDACRFIEQGATQSFVATTGSLAIVIFRGTQGISDWLSNLNVLPITKRYGTVHEGFYDQFSGVQAEIEAFLTNSHINRVLVSGHSLGGAVAMIAAAEWSNRLGFVDLIYTYGQPAVGTGDFVDFMSKSYGQKIFRFVNDWDIVPRVPPGYSHAGRLFHFDAQGNLSTGANESVVMGEATVPDMLTDQELIDLKKELRSPRTEEGLFTIFSDHAMTQYIAKINRIALSNP